MSLKTLSKLVFVILFMMSIFIYMNKTACAEMKTFKKEYTYQAAKQTASYLRERSPFRR